MRPISHYLLTLLPIPVSLVLAFLCAGPLSGGMLTYTPNIAWLMTLAILAHYPPAWPYGWAFLLGLLQDLVNATPLGAQALLTVALYYMAKRSAQRGAMLRFRLRWLEAAGLLVGCHVVLWALMHMVLPEGPSLRALIRLGLMNALWFPLFYGFWSWTLRPLPEGR